DVLAAESLEVSVQMNRVQAAEPWNEIFVTLRAGIDLAGVLFQLSAGNQVNYDEWYVELSLKPGQSLSLSSFLEALVNRLLPGDFKLPETFPSVTCTGADLVVAPGSGTLAAK